VGEYGGISWAGPSDRLGHWASNVLIVSILTAIVIGVCPLPAGSFVSICVPILVMAVVIASWLKMREHDRRLCEWCAQAIPLNVEAAAARLHRRFAIAHASERRWLMGSYITVLIASNGLLWLGLYGRIGWAIAQTSVIYLVVVAGSHRRFQPWCPQCREGNGGRERMAAPDPLPQGGRS
jgi:multisubunit Na+/H+ antiporter MnhC subunit